MAESRDRGHRLRDAPPWVHASALGAFSVITLVLPVLYNIYRDADVWQLWAGETLKADHAFNEQIRASIFRTRANTWSNIGFIFTGIYIAAYAWWDTRRETTQHDPYAVRQPALMGLFGIACIVLGFGSGAMHAAMTGWGHRADVFGMFAVLIALVALQLGRWLPTIPVAGKLLPTWPILGFVAIAFSVFLINYMNYLGGGLAVFVGLLVVTWFVITIDALRGKTSQQRYWLALAGITLIVAYYIWNLDKARKFSSPETWFQGHAVWHLLNAVTLGSMAMLYRTELPVVGKGTAVTNNQRS